MSNLTRPTVDLLKNTLSKADFGHYLEGDVTTGAKHLVLKKDGYDFVAADTDFVILSASAGQKMKRVLTPSWTYDGSKSKTFQIEITKQPLYNGSPEDQFPVVHAYQFTMSAFNGTSGTINATDKGTLIDGLIAAITADVQVNPNAISSGAVVVATKVNSTLVLEAKETGTIFTVRTYESEFTQPVLPTVGYMKDKLSNDEVARIFSIKDENVGSRVNVPIEGVDYSCIRIITRTQFVGIDLLGGKGQVVEQRLNIYTPTSQLEELVADLYTADGDNDDAMAGTTPDSTIEELIEYLRA